MRSITAAVLLALAAPVAAQTPDDDPRPRGTVAATLLHTFEAPTAGVDATWRVGRFDLQGVYVRETEGADFDPEWKRTLEWMSVGIIRPVSGPPRFRPHVLAGFELFRDTTNMCALIRLQGGDCESFPHRRPGVYGGLGVEIPFGASRFLARLQYLTSAVYVYEQVAVGHRFRASVGIGF